jgi:hypothetical protein
VAGVQKIEAAVREDNLFAAFAMGLKRLLECVAAENFL